MKIKLKAKCLYHDLQYEYNYYEETRSEGIRYNYIITCIGCNLDSIWWHIPKTTEDWDDFIKAIQAVSYHLVEDMGYKRFLKHCKIPPNTKEWETYLKNAIELEEYLKKEEGK